MKTLDFDTLLHCFLKIYYLTYTYSAKMPINYINHSLGIFKTKNMFYDKQC